MLVFLAAEVTGLRLASCNFGSEGQQLVAHVVGAADIAVVGESIPLHFEVPVPADAGDLKEWFEREVASAPERLFGGEVRRAMG
jgi:hypothetical protein